MIRQLLLVLMLCLGGTASLTPQPSAFRYRAERSRDGLVLHYRKSNLDGTHPSHLFLFAAAPDRLESFKWADGDTVATLVKAWMDTTRLTVRRFEASRISQGSSRPTATLEALSGSDQLEVVVADNRSTATIGHWPWHSYDFDFAGLGWAIRHLVAPEGRFAIGIGDVDQAAPGVPIKDWGPVDVAFVKRERWHGRETRRYSIDGEGLLHEGGTLWVDLATGFLAGYEIALPDEPGMKNDRVVLVETLPMTESRWPDFQREHLTPKSRSPR